MNLNQPSLVQFESERKKNNYIPPNGSNSFYDIGTGKINIHVLNDNPENYRFDIYTDNGKVYTGPGNFIVSGEIGDPVKPYRNMNVIEDTELLVNQMLTVSKGEMDIHGTIELMKGSKLVICDGAKVTLFSDGLLIINDLSDIIISPDSSLTIYGRVKIHLNKMKSIIDNKNIIIDSAAVMEVTGLDLLGERVYSMTDYYTELTSQTINKHTQGEKNFSFGRIGYTWIEGDPLTGAQVLKMSVMWGEAVLGDFKFSVLGLPEHEIPNLQIISEMYISKNTTLHISESFNEKTYVMPELYLGRLIGRSKKTGSCTVDGTIIVDGKNASINVDRGATLTIGETGEIYLKNGATLLSTYNDNDPVLFINGTLTIDTIEQISSFNHDNIVFGKNGKIIILNPDTGEKKLLWTTPHGIENTDLYRLFKDRIDHIIYHISNNNGIGIDQYYEYYATQFTKWYGDRRIEQAIYDGIIVWHDGGFIELYHDIIPWVQTDCTLLHAARIFKTFGSYDKDKLQDAVNRLRYAGCGNILFRFIDGNSVGEIMLVLEGIEMKNVINYPLTNNYILNTDNDGQLFLRNKIGTASQENIINEKSRVVEVKDKKAEFPLK